MSKVSEFFERPENSARSAIWNWIKRKQAKQRSSWCVVIKSDRGQPRESRFDSPDDTHHPGVRCHVKDKVCFFLFLPRILVHAQHFCFRGPLKVLKSAGSIPRREGSSVCSSSDGNLPKGRLWVLFEKGKVQRERESMVKQNRRMTRRRMMMA